MERRNTEKKYYVVYAQDRGLLWDAHIIIGKTPIGWETKIIQGTLPPMTAKELCGFFGAEFNPLYATRNHLKTRINRVIKAAAFHTGEYVANRIELRTAIDTRLCPHCKRMVCKSLSAGYRYECLYCNEGLKNKETIRTDKKQGR